MEQEDKPQPRPFFSLGPGMQIMLLVSLYLACTGIINWLSGVPSFAWLTADPNGGYSVTMARLGMATLTIVMFGVPAMVYTNVFPHERFYFFRLHKRGGTVPVLIAALTVVASVIGVAVLNAKIDELITNPDIQAMEAVSRKSYDWVMNMPSVGDLAMCLLVSAFVPALCEELFFRGVMQQLFTRIVRNPHTAVWLTAGIFSFLHYDIAGFLPRILLGAALGYFFLWTGSLRVNVLAHFVFNSFDIVNIYANQHAPGSAWAKWNPGTVDAVISLVVAAGFFYLFYRVTHRRKMT